MTITTNNYIQPQLSPKQKFTLGLAISLILAPPSQADTFDVTEPNDDGTGMVDNSLSWAILQANTTPDDDVIVLNTDVSITGVMKRIIDSDTTIQSDATRRTIDGNGQFRPLFIKSGQVTIKSLDISNGMAKGGSTGDGGAGAGLGGGLFIYAGHVRLIDINFYNNTAAGGDINMAGKHGGGGMFGSGNLYAGGGLFGAAMGNFVNGGYGGYGNYQNPQAPNFGEGGGYVSTYVEAMGGFGGGGAYAYDDVGAHGGFGGGGGFAYNDYSPQFNGGNGGFGAGGGTNLYAASNNGIAGFGGSGQHAAGFGGALFIRSGQLLVEGIQFANNEALSSGAAEGLGGALFIQHSTTQANGNNQGMPNNLASFYGCSATLWDNVAETDPDTALNNDSWFDLANRQVGLAGPTIVDTCLNDQDIQIVGRGIEILSQDTTPDVSDGTDFGDVMANYNPRVATFELNNLGAGGLVLTGNEQIELINQASNHFTLEVDPDVELIPGNQSTTFSISFLPTNFIAYSATVRIRSNDPDEPTYTFDISGQGIPYNEIIFDSSFE